MKIIEYEGDLDKTDYNDFIAIMKFDYKGYLAFKRNYFIDEENFNLLKLVYLEIFNYKKVEQEDKILAAYKLKSPIFSFDIVKEWKIERDLYNIDENIINRNSSNKFPKSIDLAYRIKI